MAKRPAAKKKPKKAKRGPKGARVSGWTETTTPAPEPVSTPDQEKRAGLAALAKRRANPPEQINNAVLYAGSPMYFYCRSCRHLADVKPESYVTPPKKLCDECQSLKDAGWLEE